MKFTKTLNQVEAGGHCLFFWLAGAAGGAGAQEGGAQAKAEGRQLRQVFRGWGGGRGGHGLRTGRRCGGGKRG